MDSSGRVASPAEMRELHPVDHGELKLSLGKARGEFTLIADEISNTSRVHAVAVSTDYRSITIESYGYLLPVAAAAEVTDDRAARDLNHIEFSNFHSLP
jgi:hypothetical protein